MVSTDGSNTYDMLSHSFLIIMWWVSLWLLAEETIIYVSGNKKHIKMSICVVMICIIAFYSFMNPTFALKM
jgi:hypothetical protein